MHLHPRSIVLACLVLQACASIKVGPVASFPKDEQDGIRFYRPHPYVWITGSDGGACKATLTYLPRMQEEWQIKATPGFIGTVTFEPTIADGWNLVGIKGAVDPKMAEVIESIAGIASSAVAADAAAPGTRPAERPAGMHQGLYKVTFDGNGYVSGLTLVSPFMTTDAKPIDCLAQPMSGAKEK